jgi:hypothetical protein
MLNRPSAAEQTTVGGSGPRSSAGALIRRPAGRYRNDYGLGVLFPSKPTDNESFTSWARKDANLAFGKNLGGKRDIAGLKLVRRLQADEMDLKFSQLEFAPWNKLASDPVAVVAHGNPKGAALRLRNGETLSVTGTEFARVVNFDQNFKSAIGANPGGSLAVLSCNLANPSGTAAQDFANLMHSLGNRRTIFAPTNRVRISDGQDVNGSLTNPGRDIASLSVMHGGEFKTITPNPNG